MDNIQRDFRAKANMGTGFYNPDGSQSRAFGFRPEPAPTKIPVTMGPAPAPQIPARPNSGPQMPAPPNMGPQRPGLMSRVATSAIGAIHGGETVGEAAGRYGSAAVNAGKSLSGSLPGRAATALGKGAIRATPWLAGAADAAGVVDVATDPSKTKLDVGAEIAGDVGRWTSAGLGAKVGAAAGAMTGPLAPAAVPVLGLAGGVAGYVGADKLIKGLGGERPSDTSNGVVSQVVAGTPLDFRGRSSTGVDAVTQAAPVVKPTASAQPAPLSPELQRVKDSTFDANSDPFTRRADPEAELSRQQRNFASVADGGNGLGGAVESAFRAQRGKFSDGRKAFADEDTRALFNTNQALQGTGIQAEKQANGVTEFSGSNISGLGGKLYRAADGSVTNDWSKTKDYADQIQRNAQDQSRLAELTRGAALSGDKEAVARLTAGDGRLQAIAADAATERDLRQAVRGGSAKAAQVLATMESARATAANQQADLGLRRAALVSAQEDRDLNRQLRQDALAERVASNRLAAQKDKREHALKGVETLDKQLEQYATVDGKLDGEKLSRIRGLAANLQKSPGQTDESYRKDVTTLISLASKLDGGQAFYDRWFSQAGRGGTDLRAWKKNEGIRGGLVTDQGDHFSARQWNALTDDEKRVAKLLGMKGEM